MKGMQKMAVKMSPDRVSWRTEKLDPVGDFSYVFVDKTRLTDRARRRLDDSVTPAPTIGRDARRESDYWARVKPNPVWSILPWIPVLIAVALLVLAILYGTHTWDSRRVPVFGFVAAAAVLLVLALELLPGGRYRLGWLSARDRASLDDATVVVDRGWLPEVVTGVGRQIERSLAWRDNRLGIERWQLVKWVRDIVRDSHEVSTSAKLLAQNVDPEVKDVLEEAQRRVEDRADDLIRYRNAVAELDKQLIEVGRFPEDTVRVSPEVSERQRRETVRRVRRADEALARIEDVDGAAEPAMDAVGEQREQLDDLLHERDVADA